jgi:hypothetical protein
MHKIKLVTSSFERVAEIEIPPFKPLYEILLWGSRFFRYHSRKMRPGNEEIETITYVEASCYAVVGQEPKVQDGGD